MLDASDDAFWCLSGAELLSSIALAVRRANAESDGYCSVSPDGVGATDLPAAADQLMAALGASDRPLVVFIDELDYITPSSPVTTDWEGEFNPFFRALRRVYQESTRSSPALSLVLSGVSSRWFTVEAIDGVENAALALVPEGYLPPLERSEAIEMIETLGRACGLVFDRDGANHLAETASDNPFWIRKAGSYVNSCYGRDRPAKIAPEDLERLCAEFVEVEGAQLAYSSLRHLFRVYPDLGFAALAATAGRADGVGQETLSYLGRYGILGDGLEASGPMVAEGLKRWEREDSAEAGVAELPISHAPIGVIEAGSASEAAEDEWAEMLGEVAQTRNPLERRMRELILVVIRSECSSLDKKPVDVLRSALPVERRDELRDLGASQLLKRFYWMELVQVVNRNWRWFESIFGDKAKFNMWGDVVNERPDTHAKDFDGADLALQRRGLQWFANAIDRSELL